MNVDLREVIKAIKKVDKQINFATAVALTKTANKVKKAEQAEMSKVFDKPKPFTINSVYIVPASYKQVEPTAIVGIKDKVKTGTPAAKYLQPQVSGGNRRLKKAEAKLKGAGILPSGYYIVPGQGIRLNKFGNMTKGQIGKALTVNTKGGKFFISEGIGRTRHLSKGVWQKKGARGLKISPFIMFVKKARYNKQFFFYATANDTAKKIIVDEFKAAYSHALSTAR